MSFPTVFRPDLPVAGAYKMRLVRGGPFVVVRVWRGFGRDPLTGQEIERGYHWRAMRDGRQVDIWSVWPGCASHPIDETEAQKIEARKSDPEAPERFPGSPVDLGTMKPIF